MIEALPFGLAIGLALGLLGGGGSILAVPVLVYVFGESAHDATTASLVVVTAGALAGGLEYQRRGSVCWRHAGTFVVGAAPGVVAGTVLGNQVQGDTLIAAFAVMMLAVAGATWHRLDRTTPPPGAADSAGCPPLRLLRAALAGTVVGLTTGFFGVAGGFLIVPALALVLAFPMRLAAGTSLAIIGGSSLVGLAAHLMAGRAPDMGVTVGMSLACVAGALAGAALAERVPQRALGRGFAVLVAAIAIVVLVSAV